jgi:hypothetical protein
MVIARKEHQMTAKPPPQFSGICTYRDADGVFELRYPRNWNVFSLASGQDGIMVSPEAQAPQSYLAAYKQHLDERITLEDLDDLRLGLDGGVQDQFDCTIDNRSEDIFDNLMRFERIFTFRQGRVTCKRRLWVIYADRWQIVLIWHGATIEEFHYWYPMTNYSFLTLKLSDFLWFLTDRELATSEKTTGGSMA